MYAKYEMAEMLKSILNLEREPVAVKFLQQIDDKIKSGYDGLTKSRYCQALMRAGGGEKVMLTADNIICPASAAAFGLKPLPEVLESGQMLYNMGLFGSLEAGKKAMESMTRLDNGLYKAVILSPLKDMEFDPDIVVIESKPEHLMWISLASIYDTGERLSFDTAVFQATCVDSTVIPFVRGKLNATLGCYGCREATNIGDDENLLGIPYSILPNIIKNLEQLSAKPMLKARAKSVFQSFNVR